MAMTLRLTEEQEMKLAQLAEQMHVSRAAIIKQALDEKLDRELHKQQVREATEFFRERDSAILDRLSQ